MSHRYLFPTGLLLLAMSALPLVGQLQQERVDLEAMAKIREEGLQRSQVMQITSLLTDGFGPRLTNSPNIKAAAQWTTKKLTEWGLTNVKLEPWGPFGRGWSNERMYVAMTRPYPFPLIGYSRAWTPGTSGAVKGDAVIAVINTPEDLEDCRGKLRGKFVMTTAPSNLPAVFQAPGSRFSDQQLDTMANPPQRGGGRGGGGGPGARGAAPTPAKLPGQLCGGTLPAPQVARGQGQQAQPDPFPALRNRFYLDEGILALVAPGQAAGYVAGGTVVVQSGGGWRPTDPPVPAMISLAAEHYGILARDLANGIPVALEASIENKFYDDDLNSFNIIGELPGTDKADEVVMIGAHFDSWHTGTGATDNAAGSAVMMEAMRILKAAKLPLRRTVRIALWTGEEEGLFGSQAYVREHFGTAQALKPEHAKLSVYFNVDNGTGQIRGVYMQGNEGVRPVFESWMEPFKDFTMTTLTARATGGTDHTNFDSVGLPGFQFIQDDIEYDTRTHHSNMDVYERVQAKDMMQNAIIVAAFAYNAANRNELLPRKPLPAPGQRGGRGQ